MDNLTIAQLNECLPYLSVRVKQSSIDIATDYLVAGLPLTSVAKKYECTKQNVLGIAKRVMTARTQYLEAQNRMQS